MHFADLGFHGRQRGDERGLALLIIGFVRRVDSHEIRGQRLGGRLDIIGFVPQMRIVARLAADELGDHDRPAAGFLVGAEQLLHPGIVVRAVDDNDPGVGQRLRGLRARLEEMRILIRIGQDAGDRNIGAADLGGDVAIEILGRDDLHGVGECGRRRRGGQRKAGKETDGKHELKLPMLAATFGGGECVML